MEREKTRKEGRKEERKTEGERDFVFDCIYLSLDRYMHNICQISLYTAMSTINNASFMPFCTPATNQVNCNPIARTATSYLSLLQFLISYLILTFSSTLTSYYPHENITEDHINTK